MAQSISVTLCLAALCPALPASSQMTTADLSQETETVSRVLHAPPFQRAVEYIETAEDETVQEWISLCNASGPSGNEGRRSRLLYKLFRIYGLERVHIDDAWNVIGIRPGVGQGPTVVLNAHFDNVVLSPVDQPVEAFVADGRVWCPAAFDDLAGTTQLLTVLRAMNAANIETEGDVWFVGLTGEEAAFGPEHPDASPGAEQLIRANYPHNIDWRNGDILVQFHGRGGQGVTTGSTPVRHRTQLRVFAPFVRDRWGPHAVDALAKIIVSIGSEVRDPRSTDLPFERSAVTPLPTEVLFMNMSRIEASSITSNPASEAWVRFDMRAANEVRLWTAHEAIQRIAADVTTQMGEEYSFIYEINSKNGTEDGIDGWNPADNPPARMAAAAAAALYGVEPRIDAATGCGDCVRAYRTGMPAMSLTGSVRDVGGGQYQTGARSTLASPTRRRTATHDVTESAEIAMLWSGVKHGLLFTLSYVGLSNCRGGC